MLHLAVLLSEVPMVMGTVAGAHIWMAAPPGAVGAAKTDSRTLVGWRDSRRPTGPPFVACALRAPSMRSSFMRSQSTSSRAPAAPHPRVQGWGARGTGHLAPQALVQAAELGAHGMLGTEAMQPRQWQACCPCR